MTNFAPVFGAYDYQAVGGVYVQEVDDPVAVKQRTADTPGADGAFTAGGLLDKKVVTLSGMIAKADGTLRDAWEAFRAAHAPGLPQALYLYSDRYMFAEVTGITNSKFNALANLQIEFEVQFTGCDPFTYDTSVTTTSGLDAGGTVTAVGTAPGAPIWTLVIDDIGTNGSVTVTNTTTGQAFTLKPAATGTYLIDSRLQTVTLSGVDVSDQFSGVFPLIAVGDNTITVATTLSLSVASLVCAAPGRYW
jgi:phage-related protein